VSAIKISGERSYARVRAGLDVELPARPVEISQFSVRSSRAHEISGVPVLDLDVEVECSTGTYVRALARDLGAELGVGGHVTALRRTKVGAFSIGEAQRLEEREQGLALISLDSVVRRCFATLAVTDVQASYVGNGRRLTNVVLPEATSAVLTGAGEFLALYRQEGSDAVAESVFI
jgi:tRNA pseudouridine55 synthase